MRRLTVFALLLATLSLFAAPNPSPQNLDFETGTPGSLPPGWISPTAHVGYAAELTTDSPKQGRQSVRVSGAPKESPESRQPVFGNVMQTIDATPYRGKRVRFRGAVRVEGTAATAALWMRVDLAQRQMGFFDNMRDRPIRSAQWTYYEIAGDVASDAEVLNIGMMLQHEGRAWLDDVTIEVLEKSAMRNAPPRALTPRGLDNVAAFARLYGVIRYFHPSDEAASADWDAIAIAGAELAEGAKDAPELAKKLGEIFAPVAPSVRIFPTSAPQRAAVVKPADAQSIVAWEHHGRGETNPRSMYTSNRARRLLAEPDPKFPDPSQPLQLDLGGGVSASVPLALYANAEGTTPRASGTALSADRSAFTGNDRATRIGAVIIAWTIFQHFYPYFDVIDADWPAELRTALRAAATDRDQTAFHETLRRLVVAIDDGHGNVYQMTTAPRASLPVHWRVVDNKLVVVRAGAEDSGLQPGDEIVSIDGVPAMQAVAQTEALVSGATPQWRRFSALSNVGSGANGSKAALVVRNADGTTRTVNLARVVTREPVREPRPEKIAELQPGIWYVDLDRINDADFDGALDKLAQAKGIVFDVRGYPRVGTKPLRHLIDAPTESARWNIPILRRPDQAGVEWNTGGRWNLQPLQPRLTKNVVFLTDGRAISYAESWMGIIEAHKLATIVGEPTAGTNGNINSFDLPGNYRVVFTGMKVLKHDGTRHHGVGIAPNVRVSPTIAGIRAGRDEQLEKAIELLTKN